MNENIFGKRLPWEDEISNHADFLMSNCVEKFLHFFTKILKKYVLFSKTSGIIRLSQMADDRAENYKEEIKMKKNTGFNNQRTFGVEIEFFLGRTNRRGAYAEEVAQAVREQGIRCYVEGYNHTTRPYWKIVTDSSVNYEGLEIVSPILKGQDGFNQLEKVLKALNQVGAKVDRTCGIHVHHDANDFSLRTFKNLYGMYARYEDCIDELVAKSRRGSNNRYCQSPRTNLEQLQNAKSVDEIINRVYPSRYIKLNCQSFRRHGTIEFRQHGGSTEYQKIKSWIVFTQMMVERAVNGAIQLKKGATDWFNFKKVIRGYGWMGADELQQEAISYLNKRRQELAKKYNLTLAS